MVLARAIRAWNEYYSNKLFLRVSKLQWNAHIEMVETKTKCTVTTSAVVPKAHTHMIISHFNSNSNVLWKNTYPKNTQPAWLAQLNQLLVHRFWIRFYAAYNSTCCRCTPFCLHICPVLYYYRAKRQT